jgi:hypothetical protein
VRTSERYAEGEATAAQLRLARAAALEVVPDSRRPTYWAGLAAAEAAADDMAAVAVASDSLVEKAGVELAQTLRPPQRKRLVNRVGAAARAAILRDLFGNPFCPVPLDPAWLAWGNGTVRAIAEAVRHKRTYDRLPILADALEDAGCTDSSVLTHCRTPSRHCRGCWVLDMLLGEA